MRRLHAITLLAAVAGCVVVKDLPPRDEKGDSTASAATSPVAEPRTFDRALQLETTSETSANVSIGDLDGDGRPDLVLAKGRHWPLVDRVLLGDGHGKFANAFDLGPASDRSYSGLLVDLDGDGDLDVVISNDNPDPKRTYLNDGTGHFVEGTTFGRPEWETRNASVSDLNGDGLPDIIVANRSGKSGGASYICLNLGGGKFGADCIPFSQESSTTITPADVNGDGLPDLIVPNRDGGQSYVYVHSATRDSVAFRKLPFGPADATIREAGAADLDGDGAVDIVTIDERVGVTLYFGQGAGAFSAGVPLAADSASPYALALGDLNGDGRVDIVVGHVKAPTTVHFNDGSGRRFRAVQVGDNRGTVYGLAIGDLDGDGSADLAVARSDAPNMVYFASPPPTR